MSTDFPEGLPEHDRHRRQEEALSAEADRARELGTHYDMVADEFEVVLTIPQSTSERILSSDLRNLLAQDEKIRDPGSIDSDFVRRLGYDVCLRPELIELAVGVAQLKSRDGFIEVEEIINAWDYIEQKYNEGVDTSNAVSILQAHGADPHEVIELAANDPKTVKSYARLLDAPILAGYSKRLAERALKKREVLPLENIVAGAMGIIRRHNERIAGLEAGDPEAIQAHEMMLRSSKFGEAAAEAAMRAEAEADTSSDFPTPESNGE
ncbi:hypothetical protein HY379_02195 [Candidatus Saccharibacteria bacterium]|nr:hypothetical protein [Candidatus Saccharibacteria bacterium]